VLRANLNTVSDSRRAAEMASSATEGTTALAVENDATSAETTAAEGRGEPEPGEPGEPGRSAAPKMEAVDAEAGEEKPAAAAGEAASEAVTDGSAVTVCPGEPEQKIELQETPGGGNENPAADSALKEAKEEPGAGGRCSGINCEKSKTVREDGEKPGGGGGALGDKRRPSLEISSSDGEPLSRMDTEDRWVDGGTAYRCSGVDAAVVTSVISSHLGQLTLNQ